MLWLNIVLVKYIAPAVREGYSWASNNLHLIRFIYTLCCGIIVMYLVGQTLFICYV